MEKAKFAGVIALVLGIPAFLYYTVAILTSLWILVIPPALIVGLYLRGRLKRYWALRSSGYYASASRDRIFYEERIGKSIRGFDLPLDRMDVAISFWFVPDSLKWKELVPDWAKDRRGELTKRMASAMKPDEVQFESDFRRRA